MEFDASNGTLRINLAKVLYVEKEDFINPSIYSIRFDFGNNDFIKVTYETEEIRDKDFDSLKF